MNTKKIVIAAMIYAASWSIAFSITMSPDFLPGNFTTETSEGQYQDLLGATYGIIFCGISSSLFGSFIGLLHLLLIHFARRIRRKGNLALYPWSPVIGLLTGLLLFGILHLPGSYFRWNGFDYYGPTYAKAALFASIFAGITVGRYLFLRGEKPPIAIQGTSENETWPPPPKYLS